MRENHRHFCGWTIEWDNRTDGGFRFWICELIYTPGGHSFDTALHHMDMFQSIEEGIEVCEDLICKIINAQAALTYRRVSDYHHSRNLTTATDTGNSDYIPF
jgi:hypothetical protein